MTRHWECFKVVLEGFTLQMSKMVHPIHDSTFLLEYSIIYHQREQKLKGKTNIFLSSF
jgi:hypothetical protein